MKQNNVFAIIIITLILGCNKYEEGPKISFRSAKSRVEGKWKVTSHLYKDQEQINKWDWSNFRIVTCKNGSTLITGGPGIERDALVEFTMEFKKGGDLEKSQKTIYEKLDWDESEKNCIPVWDRVYEKTAQTKSVWALDGNKENIQENGPTSATYEILQLKEKNMKLRNATSAGIHVYTLEKL